jgi:diadenylate cyclase
MDLYSQFVAYDVFRIMLDVAILSFLIYKAYEILVKTQAVQIIRGAGLLAGLYGLSEILRLATLQWILKTLGPSLVVMIAVVFQPELRKIFLRLGQADFFRLGNSPGQNAVHTEAVIAAAEILSRKKRGALIVFPRRVKLQNILDTGTLIRAEISSTLIVTVFEFDGPLHDGAMLIQNGKIEAAGCFLPLSEQQDIRKSFGTRHRAALGMSEQSDAVILVISEETGAISLAYDTKLYYDLSPIEAQRKLKDLLNKGVGGKKELKQSAFSGPLDGPKEADGALTVEGVKHIDSLSNAGKL